MIIELDLSKYPELLELVSEDIPKFKEIMETYHTMANDDVKKGIDIPSISRTFNIPFNDFVRLLVEVFADYKGIVRHHHDPQEAKAMEILKEENNPLSIFLGQTPAYDIHGNTITPKEFTTDDTLKDFLQGMLYGLRFVSSKDLAHYLMLGEYDLVNNLKAQNVEKLISIQPALQYQKEHDIPIGKRLPGTGFFWLGESNQTKQCPACQDEDLVNYEEHTYCKKCKGVYESV